MFCEVAEKSECVMFCGGEKVWFSDCLLLSAQAAKEPLMGGEARVEVSSVFGELPSLGFEFEVLGDERPVEGRHPVGDVVEFVNLGLIVVLMRGKLDGGEVVDVVVKRISAETGMLFWSCLSLARRLCSL